MKKLREVYLEFKRYSDGIKAALTKIDLGVNRVHSINHAIRNQSRNDQAASMEILKSVVDECLVVVGSRLRLLEVDVRIDPALQIEMVRSQFGQVIMNLLANAADAVEAHLDAGIPTQKGRSASPREPSMESSRWSLRIVVLGFLPSCVPKF